jgi:pyruvate formate lyase activating enzyme
LADRGGSGGSGHRGAAAGDKTGRGPLVFDVHRASTHDGPGLRTVFFLKGCTLRCLWCHNPESLQAGRDLWWRKEKCIAYGACLAADTTGAVTAREVPAGAGRGAAANPSFAIAVTRPLPAFPAAAVEACPTGALEPIGEAQSVEDVLDTALRDERFHRKSGGGITVSGGEPLMFPGFVRELFAAYHSQSEGGTTALDTAANVPWSALEEVLPETDLLFLDIKALDSQLHSALTGAGNGRILDNVRRLGAYIRHSGSPKLTLRTPLVPVSAAHPNGDSNGAREGTARPKVLTSIAGFIQEELSDVTERWELCAFHNLAADKYRRLGMEWDYADSDLLPAPAAEALLDSAKASLPADFPVLLVGLTARVDARPL